MNHKNKKVIGGSNCPRTKLKELWREMPEDERERWRAVFVSNVPNADVREMIRTELNICLAVDAQLCRFRDWVELEFERQELEERVKEDERYWEEQFGKDEGAEKARKKLLACSYARALRYGNYQDGLRTLRGDYRMKKLGLEERRVELAAQNSAHLIRDGEARALELCLEDSKKYPDVVDQFREAFAALKEARNQ